MLSGHGLTLYEERHLFSVALPSKPASRANYDAAQVVLFDSSGPSQVQLSDVSGSLLLDREKGDATVGFYVDGKAFPGNGTYPYSPGN